MPGPEATGAHTPPAIHKAPDAVDLSQLRRALVIKLRHHGDVLLTSPLFGVLKSRAPHLEIDALVYELYDLTEDEVRIVEGGLR